MRFEEQRRQQLGSNSGTKCSLSEGTTALSGIFDEMRIRSWWRRIIVWRGWVGLDPSMHGRLRIPHLGEVRGRTWGPPSRCEIRAPSC